MINVLHAQRLCTEFGLFIDKAIRIKGNKIQLTFIRDGCQRSNAVTTRHVIAVHKQDILTLSQTHASIACCRRTCILFAYDRNTVVFFIILLHDRQSFIIRPIVDANNLDIPIILPLNAIDAFPQELAGVKRRNNDGHSRSSHPGHVIPRAFCINGNRVILIHKLREAYAQFALNDLPGARNSVPMFCNYQFSSMDIVRCKAFLFKNADHIIQHTL